MKQLIICSDGTWQKITSPYPTNVVKLTQAIAYNADNLIFYGEGIGTGNLVDQIAGGLFFIWLWQAAKFGFDIRST